MLQGLVKDVHGSCDPLQGNVGLPRNLITKVVAKAPPGKAPIVTKFIHSLVCPERRRCYWVLRNCIIRNQATLEHCSPSCSESSQGHLSKEQSSYQDEEKSPCWVFSTLFQLKAPFCHFKVFGGFNLETLQNSSSLTALHAVSVGTIPMTRKKHCLS